MAMLRDIVTINDGTEDGLTVYVTYEEQREETEDGFIRIPAGIYIGKIQIESFDGFDIVPLLDHYGVYDYICDDIIKKLDYGI